MANQTTQDLLIGGSEIAFDLGAKIEELKQSTKVQLKELAEEFNYEHDLDQHDPGYIPTSASKQEIAEALAKQSFLAEVKNRPVANVRSDTKLVKLSQLETDPQNFRHEVDYDDTQLQKDILQAGGLLKAPIVTPTGRVNEDGDEVYTIVGGNRSTESLRRLLREREVPFNEYELHVIVREYEGDEQERQIQKLTEMINDNESQQALSPVDLLHAYRELEEAGISRSDIAERFGKSPGHVSQILKFGMLPNRVLDLMHFESNKDKLSSRADEDFYTKFHVPFRKNEDGTYEVFGISYKNAMSMTSIFNRKPARTASKEEHNEWAQHVSDVQDFLLRADIIEAAKEKSSSAFASFLKEKAAEAGLIEGRKPAPKKEDEEKAEAKVEEVGEQPSEAEAQEVTGKEKEEEETIDEDLSTSASDYIEQLSSGQLDLSVDWAENLISELKMGHPEALRSLKWMIAHDILVEV